MNKVPVCVASSPGFVVNRLGTAYFTSAGHMFVHGGASIERIDLLCKWLGLVLGPFTALDTITLPTVKRVSACITAMLGPERSFDARGLRLLIDDMQEKKWLGRAPHGESLGFYRYRDGQQLRVNEQVKRGEVARPVARYAPPSPPRGHCFSHPMKPQPFFLRSWCP